MTAALQRAARQEGGAVLRQLHPASTEDLQANALLSRFDSKFLLRREDLDELVLRLAPSHRVLLAAGEPLARYTTTYFDDSEFGFYQAHRAGRPRRQKVRIRHYLDRRCSMLELKERAPNGRSRKTRVDHPFGDDSLSAHDLSTLRASGCSRPSLQPTLRTVFSRLTLIGVDERVTTDSDVTFTDSTDELSLPQVSIVEVKRSRPGPGRVGALLRQLGARETSFSKYAVGVTLLRQERPGTLVTSLKALAALGTVAS